MDRQGRCSVGDHQGDIDVSAGGVGVKADDVGLLHQVFDHGAFHTGHADGQLYLDGKTREDGTDTDFAGDAGVSWQGLLVAQGHKLQCAQEAGRIACCKQLLGVGAAAASPPSSRGVDSCTARAPSEETAWPVRPPVAVAEAV